MNSSRRPLKRKIARCGYSMYAFLLVATSLLQFGTAQASTTVVTDSCPSGYSLVYSGQYQTFTAFSSTTVVGYYLYQNGINTSNGCAIETDIRYDTVPPTIIDPGSSGAAAAAAAAAAQAAAAQAAAAAAAQAASAEAAAAAQAAAEAAAKRGGCGCTTWTVEPTVVSLELHDRPVGYTPAVGPAIQFDVYYSQRDTQATTGLTYGNFGPKWTSTWTSYIDDSVAVNGTAALYERGGGTETYTFAHATDAAALPGPYTQAIVSRTTDANQNTTGFTRTLKDGSVEQFSQGSGSRFFLTRSVDRYGNAVTLAYDGNMRLATIMDAVGQATTLSYGNADPLKVTKVTDPFGRSATFTYNSAGQLASTTDVLGITSQYAYGSANFINKLTTPYGVTSFSFGDSTTDSTLGTTRWVMATDALGQTSRVEFNQNAPGVASSEAVVPSGLQVVNALLQQRTTYIWNASQYKLATASGSLDYTKAKLIHWMLNADASVSRVPESTKEPLEARVWYNYPGQTVLAGIGLLAGSSSAPSGVARVLDDGTTQISTTTYNGTGNVTQFVDPAARSTTYSYASNGIDLLSITNSSGGSNQLLKSFTYDSQHNPLTITGANGKTSQIAYNSAGQPTKITDALGNVTAYTYNSSGYRTAVQGPITAQTLSFSFDSNGRLASSTDSVGSTVTYTYDAADRPLTASYPDGTAVKFTYNLLDLATIVDRLGNTTQVTHDALRHVTQTTDPLGSITKFGYAADGTLNSITDPNQHITSWNLDAQGRTIGKTLADGTVQSTAYEQTVSRIHSQTDPLSQQTLYTYNADDTIASLTYSGAINPTPGVQFAWDPAFRRLTSIKDGSGTTAYTYFPVAATPALGAGLLQSASVPVAGSSNVSDVLTFTYDELSRPFGRSINGAVQSAKLDAAGRIVAITNPLDSFSYGYADATSRVTAVSSTHGPNVTLSYFDPTGNELLQEIKYSTASGQTLAQYDYTYDHDLNVSSFTERYINQQLAAQVLGSSISNSLLAGAIGTAVRTLPGKPGDRSTGNPRSNDLYEVATILAMVGLVFLTVGGRKQWSMLPQHSSRFAVTFAFASLLLLNSCSHHGRSDSPSSTPPPPTSSNPTAQVVHYAYDAASRLLSAAVGTDVSSPSAPQYAYAYDTAGNPTSIAANAPVQSVSYTSTNELASASYDSNGSPISDGSASYKWDAANRLIAYTSGSKESDFSYDGFSRLVRIVDKQSGAVVSDKAYIWCGDQRCVEHDNTQAGSPVSKQYFDQGVIIGSSPYFYVTDMLGSVRQVVDGSGVVAAQYEYDPYGNRTKVSGTADSDLEYAGYFFHTASSLYFAVFRAYDSHTSRWLNRDPIGEVGGLNLYRYASSNPTSYNDRSGLDPFQCTADSVTVCEGLGRCTEMSEAEARQVEIATAIADALGSGIKVDASTWELLQAAYDLAKSLGFNELLALDGIVNSHKLPPPSILPTPTRPIGPVSMPPPGNPLPIPGGGVTPTPTSAGQIRITPI